jgi:hypothetical protein
MTNKKEPAPVGAGTSSQAEYHYPNLDTYIIHQKKANVKEVTT